MAHFNIIKISYFFFNNQSGFNVANAQHCLNIEINKKMRYSGNFKHKEHPFLREQSPTNIVQILKQEESNIIKIMPFSQIYRIHTSLILNCEI